MLLGYCGTFEVDLNGKSSTEYEQCYMSSNLTLKIRNAK